MIREETDLTASAAASTAHVSDRTIVRACLADRNSPNYLVGERRGGSWHIKPDDLEIWIRKRKARIRSKKVKNHPTLTVDMSELEALLRRVVSEENQRLLQSDISRK